jgi:hypothetical protein
MHPASCGFLFRPRITKHTPNQHVFRFFLFLRKLKFLIATPGVSQRVPVKRNTDPIRLLDFFHFNFQSQRPFNGLWAQSESDSFDRSWYIHQLFFPYYGFRRSYVACCMLISQACFTKLTSIHLLNFCGLRVLFLFFHRRGTLSHHPARHTHTHTPHRSTVTRGRIFRKDFRRERENSEQPRSEASIEASYRKSWAEKNKSFQVETSNQTTPIKVRNSLRVHRRMTEIKYARNEHIPRAAE